MTSPTPTQGCAIVCAVSADYGFALGNLIAGFRRHNLQFAGTFVVFHDGLTAGQQAQLRSLWPRIEFRDFGLDVLEARFQGTVELADVRAMYSPMIFAKFEMPDLLAQYAACLWLDVDVLVQGDLAEIWGFEGLAWRSLPQGAFARRAGVMDAFADLRGDGTLPLLNGGVVGMGRALRGVLASDELYAMAAQVLAQAGAHSVDELALYFTAASRGLPFQPLDMRFNHPVVTPGGRDAVVLHAIGPDKFWNAAPLQLAFPEWAANAAVWAAAGGAGYDGPLRLADVQAATPDAALKAARNRAYWQQVYTDLRPSLPAALQVDLQSDRKDLRFSYLGSSQVYLRLIRQPNERRIAVEVHFADEKTLAPAVFAQLDQADIPGLQKDEALELSQTKHGWAYGAVVPLAQCGQAVSALVAALDQATSRAKS